MRCLNARGDGSLRPCGPAPDWLPAGALPDAFPFLEVFLPDAEEFWASPGDRSALYSDLWTQNELHFCAIAIAGEQKFLLIECAGAKVPSDAELRPICA